MGRLLSSRGQVADQRLLGQPGRPGERPASPAPPRPVAPVAPRVVAVLEPELEREAVEERQDHRPRLRRIEAAERALGDPARDSRRDEATGPPVRAGVQEGELAVVEGLAPEGDEHRPRLAVQGGGGQARSDEAAEPGPRVPRATRLGGHAPVEVLRDPVGGRGQDGALVPEVVVEDAGRDAGVRGHALHGQAGVAVPRQAPDGGADDGVPPHGRDADLGTHGHLLTGC